MFYVPWIFKQVISSYLSLGCSFRLAMPLKIFSPLATFIQYILRYLDGIFCLTISLLVVRRTCFVNYFLLLSKLFKCKRGKLTAVIRYYLVRDSISSKEFLQHCNNLIARGTFQLLYLKKIRVVINYYQIVTLLTFKDVKTYFFPWSLSYDAYKFLLLLILSELIAYVTLLN